MNVLWVALLSLWTAAAMAQDAPTSVDSAASAAPANVSETQRKSLIAQTVPMGRDEADGFWPLYRDYRGDVGKLQDQRAQIIAQYAQIFRTMTSDQAKSIVDESMRIDESIAKLKRDYLKKFLKFLPQTKTTRVFLIDDRFNAEALARLMAQVPVAGDAQ